MDDAIDADKMLFEIERIKCERSLVEFIRQSWHVIESQRYDHNWHVDFIAAHLEAITDGTEVDGDLYNRLLINIPPGMSKSLILNVFWPAWEWGPKNMPHLRYVCAAHKIENLSARDSRRMRELITSEWYQERWGDRVSLTKDQNEKLNFMNTAGGFRIATAMTSLTGIRGDRVLIDDPHSVDSAASDAQRRSEVDTFLEAIPNRLNNPIESAIVVIMQRLHEEDVSGVILDKKLGYDHICLPMRYEPGRACVTALGVEDPRSEEGELLFPRRFPQHVVDRDERVMGPYATAGQHQQSPTPRGGGIIQREWWQPWGEPQFPPMEFIVASIDTAYTVKQENDPSAMTVWGIFSEDSTTARATRVMGRDGEVSSVERSYTDNGAPRAMLMTAWAERLAFPDLVERVIHSCRRMRVDLLLIEAKASGISVAQEIRKLCADEGWGVQLINPGNTDKIARLYSVQHLFAEGIIYAPEKQWAEPVIHQCAVGSKGKHDDLADTTSQALTWLRKSGMLTRAPERLAEIVEGSRHRGAAPAPLYPV